MLDFIIQRTLQKNIDSHFCEICPPFFGSKNHLPVRNKRHHYGKFSIFFFALQNCPDQFPVSTVDTIKFAKCHCTFGKLRKLPAQSYVFHIMLLLLPTKTSSGADSGFLPHPTDKSL